MTMKKVIYDLGSNNGDDIPYYLKKADLVVAVEANPELCALIQSRFSDEIGRGKLVIENVVITSGEAGQSVPFFLHQTNHVLSQFPRPSVEAIGEFREVSLPARTVAEIVQRWGDPHYVKIDLEHYDCEVLRALFKSGIRPPFLSAESHDIEVFCLLVADGHYKSFKLVDGLSVSSRFFNHAIRVGDHTEFHSFPFHSAGPFGDDIPGEWLSPTEFFGHLAAAGLGWRDIHVTNVVDPVPTLASG